jgi:putative oxidoreductase
MGRIAKAVLRIGAGLLFIEHGVQKLFGLLGGFRTPGGTAQLMSRYGVAGVLETFGGLLIVIGLFTRPMAAILVVEMIVAYFIQHFPRGGSPVENAGELALLYALIFLFFACDGAGPFSVDSRIHRR